MQSRTTVHLALAFGALAGSALAAQNAPPQPPPPPLTLVVNIPAFRLDVVRDGEPVQSYGVAVGTPQYPTPRGEYAISTVTWNPWWIPPASEWARDYTVTPPGARNPMGRVKLQLAPSYLIHGTPLDQSIGSAGSHGCVRMHNSDVIALARLLQEASGIEMSDSSVTAQLAARRTHIVTLPTPIPVAIVYQTAEVRADTLLLHPDVYRLVPSRREEALAALAAPARGAASQACFAPLVSP